jgi:transcriptional regulator with XRE-family HTH domain
MTPESPSEWFDPEATTFGDRLAGARELAAMTQAELAKRLGVKEKTMADWEDDVCDPRANRLAMLAGLLNVSLQWLLTGEGDGPGESGVATSYTRGAHQLLDEIREISAQMLLNGERLSRVEEELHDLLKIENAGAA